MSERSPYVRPGFLTTRVLNPIVGFLAGRLGLPMKGARVLAVQGRRTGVWRRVPVNPITIGGVRYLVSPRGETEWARNLRASRTARLTFGRATETVRVEELADRDKVPVLRAYLGEWEWAVGRFFDVGAGASEAELRRVAPRHPVFRIVA